MRDRWGRRINYLRVSVTDRCNLRCHYCMPEGGVTLRPPEEILRLEEIARLVEVAVGLGINRIRFTGGEPLVRKNFPYLVASTASLPGVEEVALTTNGTLLAPKAEELKKAGLARVNISLDTLNPEKFALLTRGGDLGSVLEGISAALRWGLEPVKINVVIYRGFNDDEIEAFAALAQDQPLHVRFIELMPVGEAAELSGGFLPVAEVLDRLKTTTALEPATVPGNGPAYYYRLPGGRGTVGFIAAVSEKFCRTCNRLRLTADGKLRPCLDSDYEVDLKGALRSGASRQELAALFREAVAAKPPAHRFGHARRHQDCRPMWQIGG